MYCSYSVQIQVAIKINRFYFTDTDLPMFLSKTYAGYSKSRTKFISMLCVKVGVFILSRWHCALKG
jgi:hypothetical protein